MEHDHEYTRVLEDVIRVSVMADSEDHAKEKAHEYVLAQGYSGPEIMVANENPHLDGAYAVYCTAVGEQI